VNINAILSTDNANDYPVDDMKALLKVVNSKKPLAVVSDYLRLFNVFNLVVMDKSFAQQEANQNTQVFSLRCLSDTPIELFEDTKQ
jgi:hypothetical protein